MTRSSCASQLTRILIRAATDSPLPRARCATTPCTRSFTSSSSYRDDTTARTRLIANLMADRKDSSSSGSSTPAPRRSSSMLELAKAIKPTQAAMQATVGRALGLATNSQRYVEAGMILRSDSDQASIGFRDGLGEDDYRNNPEPFHFHVYSHKHNTHVTITKPDRNPILSLSCGNLGFRHANRGQYDAAYQLGAYAIDKIQQAGWHVKIHKMEVILRGFGPGREAVTKVLLSNEGRLLREKICKVSDSTRLKFGGTRSEKPRRLG